MKNRLFISLLLVILLVTAGVFLYNQHSLAPTTGDDIQTNENGETLSVLQATVIDSKTQGPVANAIVYLGTGVHQCYTDSKGQCQMKDFSWGDYGLGAYKKGYERSINSVHFEKGSNVLTIKLQKLISAPESFQVEGTVIEVITAQGTRSENHYFKIKELNGTEEYLFNDAGQNDAFNSINKKVKITGYKEIGSIGWQNDKVSGIYVEKVENLD